MTTQLTKLETFALEHNFTGKGPLSVALHVTRYAMNHGLPISREELLSGRGGQVKGLGKGAVQRVLADHGIIKVLAEEGGRTSRGSIDNANEYSAFLNRLDLEEDIDLQGIEAWWISRVRSFFASKPLKLNYDPSKSLRAIITDVLSQAVKRQLENPGTMYAGAVLQHLVGAKLELVLPVGSVEHHGSAVSDDVSGRPGDFVISDAAIHCTTSPGEALMRKCMRNIDAGFRPIIVTYSKGLSVAEGLADQAGIADRIDVLEATQFLAGNIHELGYFGSKKSKEKAVDIIAAYNQIVEDNETDPSLRIEVG